MGDLAVLVDRVNSALPKPDSVRYTAQCSKLDWEAISFSSYSPEDCRQRFMHILEKVRERDRERERERNVFFNDTLNTG